MGTCAAVQKKKLSEPYQQPPFQPQTHPESQYPLSEINLSQQAFSKIPWKIQINARKRNSLNEDSMASHQLFDIADPEMTCQSMNKGVYICLDKKCSNQFLVLCEKRWCHTCSKGHQLHPKFLLQDLTKQLRLRAFEQRYVFNKMEEIQAKIISQIIVKKLVSFNKFNTRGLDPRYGKVIEAIYITKNTKQINGGLLSELTEVLSQINNKSSRFTQQMISKFEKEALKIAQLWQKLQLEVIQEFLQYPKPIIGSYSTSTTLQKTHHSLPFVVESINPHNSFFSILTSNTIKITYIEPDNRWRSYIKTDPIPLNSTAVYGIKQLKSRQSQLFTGIATRAIFGVNEPFKNREALIYASHTGFLCENGQSSKRGCKISEGDSIALQVDTSKWQICWKIADEKVNAVIPQHLRRQSLFLVIMMCAENDCVQLRFS